MTLKSLEHLVRCDAVRGVLAEILASHDELERFFSQEFDRLESLGRELASRQEQSEQALQSQPDPRNAAEHETQRQIVSLLEEARQQQSELRNMQAMIQNQVALLTVSAELAEPRSGSKAASKQWVQGSGFAVQDSGSILCTER